MISAANPGQPSKLIRYVERLINFLLFCRASFAFLPIKNDNGDRQARDRYDLA